MSCISLDPRGMTLRAKRSPTWKMPYRMPAEPRPKTRSRPRSFIRRSSGSFAKAIAPSTNPVSVIRSQKRARWPRNVNAKSPKAAARPTTASPRLPRGKRRDHESEDHEVAERGVQLGGLQIDHRDRALLTGSPEL